MSWKVFKHAVDLALEKKIPTLNFFGGEPLLNPQALRMLKKIIEMDLSLILATNCRPLSEKEFLTRFLDITKDHKKRIVIITTRDKFHLKFYDPIHIIDHLRNEGYEVVVNDYSNETILLSEYNLNKRELRKMNTSFSCCRSEWSDHLGVLPNGGWTLCPPSLVSFGDIFSDKMEEVIKFKSQLPLRYKEGCSECLNDFKEFHKQFKMK